jgi:hypothetical protein
MPRVMAQALNSRKTLDLYREVLRQMKVDPGRKPVPEHFG